VRIDGYMEDMATERIYRLMIAQRLRHQRSVGIYDDGRRVPHNEALVRRLFDEELAKVLATLPAGTPPEAVERAHEASRISQETIFGGGFDPA
jgi:malate synthase